MNAPDPDDALQQALARAKAAEERQLQLLRRVVELTGEREKLDAQARRQAEELVALRRNLVSARRRLSVTEAARMAQWEWDIASGSVFLGKRWDEMTGEVKPGRRWEMRELLARVHPDDVAAVRRAVEDALKGTLDRYLVEHRVSVADGWIWIESVGLVTERDAQGRALRVTGFNTDITARRKMSDDMEQARAQAEASSRAKSEFLANMSHEVRTPLNAVMGLTRLLHQSPLNDEQRSYLQLIDNSATSLLALLNDVLDLSKIEAGKLVFEQVRFDIGKWVREAVALHKPAAEKKGLVVDVELARDLPWKVAGDPGRLRQVISNLISNAVKFTERGRIAVSARLAPDQTGLRRDQLRVLFSVRDSGVGIPAEMQAQIFEAFTQADASTTRRYGGTGLGLTICARLVAMMGGSLHVVSRPNEGSTFRFTAVFEEAADELSVLTEPAPLEAMTVRGLDVLLAEDHAVNELLMRKLLTQMGCDITVARTGEEAVKLWRGRPFDLVLMDVQMPVLSGLDATAQIRALEAQRPARARTPIVALTAHAMAGDRERCLAAGMDGYVSKPVSPAMLTQAIQDAMHGGHARGDAEMRYAAGDEWFELPSAPQRVGDAGADAAAKADSPSPIDLQQLLHTMAGDMGAIRQIAATMRSDMAVRRHVIGQALDERNLKVAQEQVHALKGALSTVGAHEAARIARQVEGALRQGDWQAVDSTVGLLRQETERVDIALVELAAMSG